MATDIWARAQAVESKGKALAVLAAEMFRAAADASDFVYPGDAWDAMPDHRKKVWLEHARAKLASDALKGKK